MKKKTISLLLKGKVILSNRQTQLNYEISSESFIRFYPLLNITISFQKNIDKLTEQLHETERKCFSYPLVSLDSYNCCATRDNVLECISLLNVLEEHCAAYGFVLEYIDVIGKIPAITRRQRDRVLIT